MWAWKLCHIHHWDVKLSIVHGDHPSPRRVRATLIPWCSLACVWFKDSRSGSYWRIIIQNAMAYCRLEWKFDERKFICGAVQSRCTTVNRTHPTSRTRSHERKKTWVQQVYLKAWAVSVDSPKRNGDLTVKTSDWTRSDGAQMSHLHKFGII